MSTEVEKSLERIANLLAVSVLNSISEKGLRDQVLLLKACKLTSKEIAAMLNSNVNSVDKAAHYAKKRGRKKPKKTSR